MKNSFFTTGQAAKICKVSPRAVAKWFDSGRLRGYRVPGSKDRRIPRECLDEFLRKNKMDSRGLEKPDEVLIVTQDRVLIKKLRQQATGQQLFSLETASNSFDAGLRTEFFQLVCIVVDFSIGRTECLSICQAVRNNPELKETIIIALLPDDGCSVRFNSSNIDETFRKPLEPALFIERLCTLIIR